jgi:hypothetical protein
VDGRPGPVAGVSCSTCSAPSCRAVPGRCRSGGCAVAQYDRELPDQRLQFVKRGFCVVVASGFPRESNPGS